MTFRLLHTSDWHLGQHFYGKSRKKEHQAFLTWLLEQVKIQEIDAVIVAGDIFDTGTPPSYAREMYFEFIVELHQLGCQLVVVAGNHDSVAMLGEAKAPLSHLSCVVNTMAMPDPQQHVFTLKNRSGDGQAVICALPYLRPRDITSSQAGQSSKEKQGALQHAISEQYQRVFDYAQQISDNESPIIMTGHLTTVGASVTESVRDIYIGTLDAFPASEFPQADYIALGHIHRCQSVAKTEHIRYSGSPIPLSFDEAKQTKQVLIAEFSSQGLTSVSECDIPCFQPLAMLKTNLADLEQQLDDLLADFPVTDGQSIWLDVEISSGQYLSDLSQRVEQYVEGKPVEVLLVRRSKQARNQMASQQTKTTLDELSIIDVFETRLEEEPWQTEEEQQRKSRLNLLFLNLVEEIELESQEGDKTEAGEML